MRPSDKIHQLQSLIEQTLSPLIDNDYVLLDVPYYNNIGDVLIWEGTRDWLSHLPFKCLQTSSKESFDFPQLAKEVIILLLGGGNFGDLYRQHQLFRQSVIKAYPDNKIIILPQTVFYTSWYTFKQDAAILRNHHRLTVCARDKHSYNLLKLFKASSDIRLVPDMAFCINIDKIPHVAGHGAVFIKRWDNEIAPYDYAKIIPEFEQLPTRDWPTFENDCDEWTTLKALITARSDKTDQYADYYFRPKSVTCGEGLLLPYQTVYTTRLHAMILGVLLSKNIVLFDNSYGKNADFYNSWLSDCERVVMQTSIITQMKKCELVVKAFLKLLLKRP
jgi:pyruvyl transferase EpsO